MSGQTVFVYGTLKKDHGRSLHDMTGAEYLGSDLTSPRFSMWNLGPFPAVTFKGNSRIAGEVWRVDEQVFEYLDFIEGYPDFYSREKISTQNISGKHWMYFLHPSQINSAPDSHCPRILPEDNICTWRGSDYHKSTGKDFSS